MTTEQPAVPLTGPLSRLSSPAFWLLALLAGILGAACLFVVCGLITSALTESATVISLSALGGAVIGLVVPILYLKARRTGPVHPKGRKAPPPIHGTEILGPQPETSDVPPQRPTGPAEWFYADGGRRVGPVAAEELNRMVADGAIPRTTLVWRSGMPDWVKIADSKMAKEAAPTAPPPLSSSGIANGCIWALALAPFWGAILHYIGVYAYLTATHAPPSLLDALAEHTVQKTWYIPWVLNWSLAMADEQVLIAAGWKSDKLNKWLTILVPIYIYKRDQLVGANMTRFFVWIGALIVSIVLA